MKIQYFGDVNDYRKYALLRLLAKEGGFKIGVCWMLTEDDGGPHGKNRGYREEPSKWRGFDPELFDLLTALPNRPSLADFQRIERQGLIPEAIYFEDLTPDPLTERNKFHHNCLAKLAAVDLVFFDPDNGLKVPSRHMGRKGSNKYVCYDEIAAHYAAGQSALVYQHFPMNEQRPDFLERVSTLIREETRNANVWSFETPHVAFILAAQPAHASSIHAVVQAVEQKWTPRFFRVVRRHDELVHNEAE